MTSEQDNARYQCGVECHITLSDTYTTNIILKLFIPFIFRSMYLVLFQQPNAQY